MIETPSVALNLQEQRLVHAMQLLGDSTRFKIFKLLTTGDELCVSEIAERLSISPSAVSQHFRNFELVGIVGRERFGQRICYVLKKDDELVNELQTIVKIN